MEFSFGNGHNVPQYIGQQTDGDIIIQVRGGSNLWIARDADSLQRLRSIDGSLIQGGDAISISPDAGIVTLPWSGELWAFNPQAAVETVFGALYMMGCQ